jgi:hypothetical protein
MMLILPALIKSLNPEVKDLFSQKSVAPVLLTSEEPQLPAVKL